MARLREVSVLFQGQWPAAQRRVGGIGPAFNRQAVLARCGQTRVARRVEPQRPLRQIEQRRLLAEGGIAEAYLCTFARYRQGVELIAEIGLGWPPCPGNRAVWPQPAEPGISGGDQQVTVRQRYEPHHRVLSGGQNLPVASARFAPGENRRVDCPIMTRRKQRPAVPGPRDVPKIAACDARYVGPRKPGERMAVQQSNRRTVDIANRQARSIGAERDAAGLAAVRGVDRNGGACCASRFGGVEPHLAVIRGGRQSAVRGERRAKGQVTIIRIAGGLAPVPVVVIQPDAAAVQRRRQATAIR